MPHCGIYFFAIALKNIVVQRTLGNPGCPYTLAFIAIACKITALADEKSRCKI